MSSIYHDSDENMVRNTKSMCKRRLLDVNLLDGLQFTGLLKVKVKYLYLYWITLSAI